MTAEIVGKCWSCGRELAKSEYGRETLCLGCHKPTRVCKNCRWFDPSRSHQCAETIRDPVMDKERANYCDFFEPTATNITGSGNSAEDHLKAAEDLFKGL